MPTLRNALREIGCAKGSSLLGFLAVVAAVGLVVAASILAGAEEHKTAATLAGREAEAGRARDAARAELEALNVATAFGLVILPLPGARDPAEAGRSALALLPEDAVARLCEAPVMTLDRLVPQLARHVQWPETEQQVLVVGRGPVWERDAGTWRRVPSHPCPSGSIVLGHSLHTKWGLRVGDGVEFMRREFRVHQCLEQRESIADLTVEMRLREAQELLDCRGWITEILASAGAAGGDFAGIRGELQRILPGTWVTRRADSGAVARIAALRLAESALKSTAVERRGEQQLQGQRRRVLISGNVLAVLLCVIWLGLVALRNALDRAAVCPPGSAARALRRALLVKWVLLGLVGTAVGWATGLGVSALLGDAVAQFGRMGVRLLAASLCVGALITAVGGCLPVLLLVGPAPGSPLGAPNREPSE